MTSRAVYEAILIELNKNNAPSLRLHEFNYLFNKAINEYVDEIYQNYDVNQSATDSLRVLQSEAQLQPSLVTINYPHNTENTAAITISNNEGIPTVTEPESGSNGVTINNKLKGATYEVFMPEDYLHILNCTCIYFVKQQNKCYDAGDYIEIPATKLTADSWSTIMTDIYNRPSPMKPYYYIHNRNTQSDLPTNPFRDKSINNYTFQIGNDSRVKKVYKYQEKSIYTYDDEKFYDQRDNSLVINVDKNQLGTPTTSIEEPFSRTIDLNKHITSTIEKPAAIRVSNPQKVRMEIRYGRDNSIYELVEVRIDYVKSPQFIRLTQDQIDLTADTSQIMEFPDYICQKIINKLVALLLERSNDPRLVTNVQINRSMVAPAQPQTQQQT